MKNNIFIFVVVTLLFAFISSVCDASSKDVSDYISTRDKKGLKESINDIRISNPEFNGKFIEIVGLVKTINGNEVCLKDNSDTYIYVTMPVGTDTSLLEDDTICCLVSYNKESLMSLKNLKVEKWVFKKTLDMEITQRLEKEKKTTSPVKKSYTPVKYNFQKPVEMPKIDSSPTLSKISKAIQSANPSLDNNLVENYTNAIAQYSIEYEINPLLVCAVITEESRFKYNATSRAGAGGLGQLMPATARSMGISDVYDPYQNIYGTVRYLRSMLDRLCKSKPREISFEDLSLILSGYNAGVGNVKKYGGIPPFKETRNYVTKVTNTFCKYLTIL